MNLKPWTKEFWFQEVWKKKEEKKSIDETHRRVSLHELTRSADIEPDYNFVFRGMALHEARIANIRGALDKGPIRGRRELLLEINTRERALERIKEKYLNGQYS